MAEKQAESYQLCCVCGAVQKSKPTKSFTVITAPGGRVQGGGLCDHHP